MERDGEQVTETATEARAGESTGVMRWVLGVSILFAIVAMTIIWMTGTLAN